MSFPEFRRASPTQKTLPVPPTEAEKYTYVKRHMGLLAVFTVASFACVSVSTVRFALPSRSLWLFLGLVAFSAIGFLGALCVNFLGRDFSDSDHRRLVDSWCPRDGAYPSVDVYLPICGEKLDVLMNTWRHVKLLDYPNLSIYCLDDGGSDAARNQAERLGFTYLARENRGWFKKAGNLKYAFERTSGEFLLILDADFAPRPDLLRELLPYFDADPVLGIVQTPQFFATHAQQSWLERGACAVQEFFYRVVQVSRQARDAAVCVGTNAVYRRAALEDNGGPTLIEHSEDVHTGFDLRRNGWGIRYVPVNLAAGLCPDDLSSFFRQQYRWCMGSLSLCSSRKFWRSKMRVAARMCYLVGFFYYVMTALTVITGSLVPLALVLFYPGHVHLANYLLLTPALLWTYVVLRVWHRASFRIETLSVALVYGWAHAFAIVDLMRGRPMGWTPTGAKRRDRRVYWFRVWSAAWGGGTSVLLVVACLWRVCADGYSPAQYALLFLFALIYARTNARFILDGVSLRPLVTTIQRRLRYGTKEALQSVERATGAEGQPYVALADVRA